MDYTKRGSVLAIDQKELPFDDSDIARIGGTLVNRDDSI